MYQIQFLTTNTRIDYKQSLINSCGMFITSFKKSAFQLALYIVENFNIITAESLNSVHATLRSLRKTKGGRPNSVHRLS